MISEQGKTPNLNAALAEAKKKMPAVMVSANVEIPTKSGRKITFSYAELEQIQQLIIPVISDFGLSVIHRTSFNEATGALFLVSSLRHESGEYVESVLPLTFGTGDYKDMATAIAYSRRYSFLCLLDICVVEPEDRDSSVMWLAKDIKQAVQDPSPGIKQNGSRTITEKQVKRLHAIASQHKVPTPAAKEIIKKVAGVDSSKDVELKYYDLVISALENYTLPPHQTPAQSLVTGQQASDIWAIANQRGVEKPKVKEIIKRIANVENPMEIPANLYQQVLDAIVPDQQPSVTPLPEGDVDRYLLLEEIGSLKKRKNIAPEQESSVLSDLFSVSDVDKLSGTQLVDYRNYLKTS